MKTNKWLVFYDCYYNSDTIISGNWIYYSGKLKHLLAESDIHKIQREINLIHRKVTYGLVHIKGIIPLERFK